jgi:hypothetical protein
MEGIYRVCTLVILLQPVLSHCLYCIGKYYADNKVIVDEMESYCVKYVKEVKRYIQIFVDVYVKHIFVTLCYGLDAAWSLWRPVGRIRPETIYYQLISFLYSEVFKKKLLSRQLLYLQVPHMLLT